MTEYHVGQIFEGIYPPEAAGWCNDNNCYIEEIAPRGGKSRYEIKAIPEPTPEEQEAEFNRQFFNTSLGYVRRKFTNKNGEVKDFLSDALPLLQPGVEILTYSRNLEQSKVVVTEQFISECKQQVLVDFWGN